MSVMTKSKTPELVTLIPSLEPKNGTFTLIARCQSQPCCFRICRIGPDDAHCNPGHLGLQSHAEAPKRLMRIVSVSLT